MENVTIEVLWLCFLLKELQILPSIHTLLWFDNISAMYLSNNPLFKASRDNVHKGVLKVEYLSTKDLLGISLNPTSVGNKICERVGSYKYKSHISYR